ncbi:MAG: hypothetical protein ACT4OS_01590 [Acidimicrobiales bacterium]
MFAADTTERFGRPFRHFPVAVSAEAMAQAWANTEDGPEGAVVLVDHEIGPRGLHGRLWTTPLADSLLCSIVARPLLSAEEGEVMWLVAGLAVAKAAESVSGLKVSTWWPDEVVVAGTRDTLAAVRAEIALGPGKVKNVVLTVRMDLIRLGLGREGRDQALEALVVAMDEIAADLAAEGPPAVAAAYEGRCAVLGRRVKLTLLPKGETRGVASRVNRTARLELESPTGMVERIGVDQLRTLEVV